MANSILIIGPSGSGKSSGMRNLNHKETFCLSVLDKPLPFKGYRKHYKPIKNWDDNEGNYYATDDWQRIIKCIRMVNEKRPEIKVLVLDDMQYVLASEFMRRSAENGYAKYSELANHYWQIINAAQSCRDDLVTIFISHNEVDNNGVSKIKTIGKLLDEKITIEGMFSTVLESRSTDDGYFFVTQNDGMSTCKSPFQMFDSKLIDNDLNFVIEKMNEYYNGENE